MHTTQATAARVLLLPRVEGNDTRQHTPWPAGWWVRVVLLPSRVRPLVGWDGGQEAGAAVYGGCCGRGVGR